MSEQQDVRSGETTGFDMAMSIPTARPLSDFAYERVDDDLILFDAETMQYHTLNGPAVAIWDACNGVASAPEIAQALELPIELVESTVDGFGEASLLQAPSNQWSATLSRRRASKLIAAGVVGAVGLPIVSSITAPSASAQASGQEVCPSGTCSCTPGVWVYCTNQAGSRQCTTAGSVYCN